MELVEALRTVLSVGEDVLWTSRVVRCPEVVLAEIEPCMVRPPLVHVLACPPVVQACSGPFTVARGAGWAAVGRTRGIATVHARRGAHLLPLATALRRLGVSLALVRPDDHGRGVADALGLAGLRSRAEAAFGRYGGMVALVTALTRTRKGGTWLTLPDEPAIRASGFGRACARAPGHLCVRIDPAVIVANAREVAAGGPGPLRAEGVIDALRRVFLPGFGHADPAPRVADPEKRLRELRRQVRRALLETESLPGVARIPVDGGVLILDGRRPRERPSVILPGATSVTDAGGAPVAAALVEKHRAHGLRGCDSASLFVPGLDLPAVTGFRTRVLVAADPTLLDAVARRVGEDGDLRWLPLLFLPARSCRPGRIEWIVPREVLRTLPVRAFVASGRSADVWIVGKVA